MADRAKRVFIFSDLHLGGVQPSMMSSGPRLARCLAGLPGRLRPDERMEVVIAGDFVDFLAEAPFAAWTPDPARAVAKLRRILADSQFADVFTALRGLVAAGHDLTILIGNHDVELVLPAVQEALLAALGATPHRVHFVDDGRAYRIGGLLIEHGNRYDPSNENDWDSLRAIASAQSRFEEPPVGYWPSAGSYVVERVVSPLKADYPFIDLLQPQGEVLALLLAAFEPALLLELPKLARVLNAQKLQAANPGGLQPVVISAVADEKARTRPDPELLRVFGASYQELRSPRVAVGAGDILLVAWQSRKDGLARLIRESREIPRRRLEQIRVAMAKLLLEDRSQQADGDTEQYGKAADRLIATSGGSVQTVVMGHTHLPRHIGMPDRASYINTGTWADVIRVPPELLKEDVDAAAFAGFLRDLLHGGLRKTPASFGDVRVEAGGAVALAKLEWAP